MEDRGGCLARLSPGGAFARTAGDRRDRSDPRPGRAERAGDRVRRRRDSRDVERRQADRRGGGDRQRSRFGTACDAAGRRPVCHLHRHRLCVPRLQKACAACAARSTRRRIGALPQGGTLSTGKHGSEDRVGAALFEEWRPGSDHRFLRQPAAGGCWIGGDSRASRRTQYAGGRGVRLARSDGRTLTMAEPTTLSPSPVTALRGSKLRHVVESQQFTVPLLMELFDRARGMERIVARGGSLDYQNRIMATLFYSPSTRTRFSFEAAMHRLGGRVLSTEHASAFSSEIDGEQVEDSIRILGCYSDVIVIRHHQEGGAKR